MIFVSVLSGLMIWSINIQYNNIRKRNLKHDVHVCCGCRCCCCCDDDNDDDCTL